MASSQTFVDYVTGQMDPNGLITSKKMFGEYGLYSGNKIFAMVCDDQLFIKPTEAGRAFIGEVVEGFPYPGARPQFLISEAQLEDIPWLKKLVSLTVAELPEPKPKKPKASKK